jgi:xanthine dehydrogenase iron-sulfur cluster and FAD-binding subunit A
MEVASSVGIDLPAGCFSGSCGICEVEVATDGGLSTTVVRACVAVVPAGVASMTVSELPDDAAWGQDGWDT